MAGDKEQPQMPPDSGGGAAPALTLAPALDLTPSEKQELARHR